LGTGKILFVCPPATFELLFMKKDEAKQSQWFVLGSWIFFGVPLVLLVGGVLVLLGTIIGFAVTGESRYGAIVGGAFGLGSAFFLLRAAQRELKGKA
jgi:hypothetical protein